MSTEKLRFGIIGAGRIARDRVAPAILSSGKVILQAAASRDMTRATQLGALRAYNDYDELICDSDVDVVYIATHNGLHRDLSIQALRAGKHVLCEKPMACTASQCEEILSTATETGLQFMEAFMYRYRPEISRAQEMVGNGAIGELKVVEASFRFHMTRSDDVRLRADWGGGALLDVGCYCVNVSRLFLGDSPTRVRAVAAMDPRHGVDRSVQGVLDYGDGRVAVISCGFESGLHQRVTLVGTEGVILLNEPFIDWTEQPRVTLVTRGREEVLPIQPLNPFLAEVEDFARAVGSGSTPLLHPDEGLLNARVLDQLAAQIVMNNDLGSD